MKHTILVMTLCVALVSCFGHPQPVEEADKGPEAPPEPVKEVEMTDKAPKGPVLSPLGAQYKDTADKIIAAALAENEAYDKLEALCLDIGPRLSGSEALDEAIAWAVKELEEDGHERVRKEKVMVPKWVRGEESATMISPRKEPLPMLGLGGSVGTPRRGITAEVAVVRDEAGLELLGEGAKGKIVLFNNPMPAFSPETGTGYGHTVRFRVRGADMASALGAKAVLVRSVTAHSLRSPHTGMLSYNGKEKKIPAAAITTEDADMIERLTRRNKTVKVTLKMGASDKGMVPSANVIAELTGRENPDEIVVISGHLDSWDVGHGAHDDGAGCVIAMEALSVLRRMNMVPRRTIRVILWTNEENGLMGGTTYAKEHAEELPQHAAAVESDSGGFDPAALAVHLKDADAMARAAKQAEGLLPLFESLHTKSVRTGFAGADIGPMLSSGVPLMGLMSDPSIYFDYHHSHADTFDKINKDELDRSVAAMALLAFILAEMPGRLGD